MKKTKRKGRPTRRAASQAALASVDLSAVDPENVLRAIAADESAPASARVAAAKALLAIDKPAGPSVQHGGDAVSSYAFLQGGKE